MKTICNSERLYLTLATVTLTDNHHSIYYLLASCKQHITSGSSATRKKRRAPYLKRYGTHSPELMIPTPMPLT